MKLKHILSILALCASATIMADESYPSITTDQLPLNDTIVDWDNDGMVIMEDGKGFVALYNNNDGIFFQVLIKDRRLQQQMLRQGLVVYVDPNGKKKKKYSVQFPTLAPPKRGERPQGERMHRDGERRFNRQDTVGMFGNIQQQDPRDRQRRQISKEEREKMLKRLIANVASQPATFLEDDEESILSQESAKVFVSGNNVVFTAYIPYDRFDKIGKKGEFALGITVKEIEEGEGFPGAGMFGPHPGMMRGGMMPPHPGMRGRFGGPGALNDVKLFSEWIVFTTKNTNFTNVN